MSNDDALWLRVLDGANDDFAIGASGSKCFGISPSSLHGSTFMMRVRMLHFTVVGLPDFAGAIHAGGHNVLSVGIESYAKDRPAMAFERFQ
jgi:hypothetical protein